MNHSEKRAIKDDINFISKSWKNVIKCSNKSEEMIHELGKVEDAFDTFTKDDAIDCIDYVSYMHKSIQRMEDSMKGHLTVFGSVDKKIYELSYNDFRLMSSNYTAHYKQARKLYDLSYHIYDNIARQKYVKSYPYIPEVE